MRKSHAPSIAITSKNINTLMNMRLLFGCTVRCSRPFLSLPEQRVNRRERVGHIPYRNRLNQCQHRVMRTPNGIKVILYVTLIVVMLILVYKKRNKITSYKEAMECLKIKWTT